ncbi:hypothetical protein QL285_044383 [Trifolium repens]|nr:hypothetical protein QL285_044383 [Trifolium repens]
MRHQPHTGGARSKYHLINISTPHHHLITYNHHPNSTPTITKWPQAPSKRRQWATHHHITNISNHTINLTTPTPLKSPPEQTSTAKTLVEQTIHHQNLPEQQIRPSPKDNNHHLQYLPPPNIKPEQQITWNHPYNNTRPEPNNQNPAKTKPLEAVAPPSPSPPSNIWHMRKNNMKIRNRNENKKKKLFSS